MEVVIAIGGGVALVFAYAVLWLALEVRDLRQQIKGVRASLEFQQGFERDRHHDVRRSINQIERALENCLGLRRTYARDAGWEPEPR